MYVYKGVVRKYRPDFLIRLATGKMLVLEVKGQDSQKDRTKREFLDECVKAVNEHGGFGHWAWAVSFDPADIPGILATYAASEGRGNHARQLDAVPHRRFAGFD
jgi:type III restriction enzyme